MSAGFDKLREEYDLMFEETKGRVQLQLLPKYFTQPLACVKGMSEWQKVKFGCPEELIKIPNNKKGVYAFVIANEGKQFPSNGYIVYVGASLKGKSSLRQRYQTYLQYSKLTDRVNIYPFIIFFSSKLFFYFSTAEDSVDKGTIANFEIELASVFTPPYSRRDLKPRLRKLRTTILGH